MTTGQMEPPGKARRAPRRPKAPGGVAMVLAVSLAVLVAITGLTSRSAPPPTVAQFAPQAVKQIKVAPRNQSSNFGTGNNGTGTGNAPVRKPPEPSPTPSAKPSPGKPQPPSHRCVGQPSRQIEDSQSPPCVPFWSGDNGGATWKGVTRDTIRIAVPIISKTDSQQVAALQNFFNQRFEFYGRKLVLFDPKVKNSDDPQVQRNDAASVEAQGAFASSGYSYNYYYAQELARRKIMSATAEPYYSEKDLRKLAPYVWQYNMALDREFANIGAWICSQLAGRNATGTTSAAYNTKKRKFGILSYSVYPEIKVDLSPLISRMRGCGADPSPVIQRGNIGNASAPDEVLNTVLALQDEGVSTVVCTCNFLQLSLMFRGATSQGYFPEWLTGTYVFNDVDYAIHGFNGDPAHVDHMFGLTFNPRELLPQNTPAIWALAEGSGQNPSAAQETTGAVFELKRLYHELLLIASGIQMAGPHLTPTTFEAGLQRTTFPNPEDGLRQGKVGFAGGSHAMTTDAAEYYWSSRATSPYSDVVGQGAFCYYQHGRRFTLQTWPRDEMPYRRTPCDSRDR